MFFNKYLKSVANIATNEREISSLLEYLLLRVQFILEFYPQYTKTSMKET